MGSGCYSTPGSNNACFGKFTPDTSVTYTGEAYPSLGICYGDKLSEIEKIILDKLIDFADGTGIVLTDIDISECAFLDQFITCCSQDKTLVGLLTTVLKSICQLEQEIIDTNTALTAATTYTFTLGCLTVANPTLQNVVNAIIANLCATNTTVATLASQLAALTIRVTALETGLAGTINTAINSALAGFATNFVNNNIKTCGNTNGISKSAGVATFEALVPPLCPIPYIGPIANFDNSGAGIAAKGYCGWYICNGANNTPDMRGYAFSSATNIPGGSLDTRVSDPADATSIGNKNGEYRHALSTAELASHAHTIAYNTTLVKFQGGANDAFPAFNVGGGAGGAGYGGLLPTSGTTGNTGSGTPHETRQPTYYGCWIMRLS